MAERSTSSSDRELLAEGLVLDEIQEKRMIARFSVAENLTPDGLCEVYVFAAGRFRVVDPIEAVMMIVENKGSLETVVKKGRPPGEIGEWRSRRRLRTSRR